MNNETRHVWVCDNWQVTSLTTHSTIAVCQYSTNAHPQNGLNLFNLFCGTANNYVTNVTTTSTTVVSRKTSLYSIQYTLYTIQILNIHSFQSPLHTTSCWTSCCPIFIFRLYLGINWNDPLVASRYASRHSPVPPSSFRPFRDSSDFRPFKRMAGLAAMMFNIII